MSLKLVQFSNTLTRVVIIAAALLTLVSGWFFVRWNFANSIAGHFDKTRPEAAMVFEWLVGLSPADPQTHYGSAVALERTFDPQDLEKSLLEYESSVAAAPYNYQTWLNLGKARSVAGDTTRAEAAFKRALELAPSYSVVHWTYGNFLIGQGDTERGIQSIAHAAATDPQYAVPAASTALQAYDGDVPRVRAVMGDTSPTNAALASTLPSMERYDDAVDAWSRLRPEEQQTEKTYVDIGQKLADKLFKANKFRLAGRVIGTLQADDAARPVTGQVNNGGFESPIKLRQAGLFEWKISEGSQPQIGMSEAQKRTGKFSVSLAFNAFESAGFRELSELVPVEPGATYEFTSYYRSDVKTAASLRWQVVDAVTLVTIAAAPPFAMAGDWTQSAIKFTVPSASDGIIIRVNREGCVGPACPVTGKLLLDDVSLRRL